MWNPIKPALTAPTPFATLSPLAPAATTVAKAVPGVAPLAAFAAKLCRGR